MDISNQLTDKVMIPPFYAMCMVDMMRREWGVNMQVIVNLA